MLQTKISSSSNSTFAFHTSSIQTTDSEENISSTKSIINFNRNANDPKKKCLHRLIQSLTDVTTINNLYSSKYREHSHRTSRIESALMTSDYSHLFINSSRPIIDVNMNRTNDLINRNGAGDENLSSHFGNNKQIQTTPTIIDNNHYLTLEQVPIHNRRKIQLTSKQLILISISVFVFVTSLCLITFFFIF